MTSTDGRVFRWFYAGGKLGALVTHNRRGYAGVRLALAGRANNGRPTEKFLPTENQAILMPGWRSMCGRS